MDNLEKELKFKEEIRSLINRYSRENESHTPDFILANYLCDCLDAFEVAVTSREAWYGRTKDIEPTVLGGSE